MPPRYRYTGLLAKLVNIFPILAELIPGGIWRQIEDKLCILGRKTGCGHIIHKQLYREPCRLSQPQRRYQRERITGHSQRSEEHTSELQSRGHLVCRLLLEKKNKYYNNTYDYKTY